MGGGLKPKAYAHYKIEHFPIYESVQGGLKTDKFERTYFLNGPMRFSMNPAWMMRASLTNKQRTCEKKISSLNMNPYVV